MWFINEVKGYYAQGECEKAITIRRNGDVEENGLYFGKQLQYLCIKNGF